MDQTTLHRIDLAIVKHHFTRPHAFDVDRKDRVSSRIRAQDCSQFSQRSDGSDCLGATAVDCDGHHAIASRASRIILAATLTHFCLHLEIFFLRHDFLNWQLPIANCQFFKSSEQTFSDEQICQLRWPIAKLAIGNRNLEISFFADGLRLSHQVFALRYTQSEETEVSSWIDLIAFARSGAILSTFILSSSHASSRSGIVLVTIIFSISDSRSSSTALPENI